MIFKGTVKLHFTISCNQPPSIDHHWSASSSCSAIIIKLCNVATCRAMILLTLACNPELHMVLNERRSLPNVWNSVHQISEIDTVQSCKWIVGGYITKEQSRRQHGRKLHDAVWRKGSVATECRLFIVLVPEQRRSSFCVGLRRRWGWIFGRWS